MGPPSRCVSDLVADRAELLREPAPHVAELLKARIRELVEHPRADDEGAVGIFARIPVLRPLEVVAPRTELFINDLGAFVGAADRSDEVVLLHVVDAHPCADAGAPPGVETACDRLVEVRGDDELWPIVRIVLAADGLEDGECCTDLCATDEEGAVGAEHSEESFVHGELPLLSTLVEGDDCRIVRPCHLELFSGEAVGLLLVRTADRLEERESVEIVACGDEDRNERVHLTGELRLFEHGPSDGHPEPDLRLDVLPVVSGRTVRREHVLDMLEEPAHEAHFCEGEVELLVHPYLLAAVTCLLNGYITREKCSKR